MERRLEGRRVGNIFSNGLFWKDEMGMAHACGHKRLSMWDERERERDGDAVSRSIFIETSLF